VLESRKGRLPGARRALVSASQISAGEAVILNNLAVSHLLEGEPAAAASLLRQGLAARELSTRHAARLKRNLALALALQGRFEEADKLAGERLPRDLANADPKRLRQLLGLSEVKVAAGSGWTTQIAMPQPRAEPALR
jgi:Flp pilus assembly protein TadD